MPELTCECPSGLTVELRGLKGRELDTFANQQTAKRQNIGRKVLEACTLNVVDPGPYDFEDRPDWSGVLAGDAMFALLKVREATFLGTVDEGILIKQRCEEDGCPSDGKPFEWVVTTDELKIQRLSPEAAEAFREGLPMASDVALSDGTYKVSHKLLAAREYERQGSKADTPTGAVRARLVRVVKPDGEEVEENDLRRWVEDLDLLDFEKMDEMLEKHDCGVKPQVDITCPACGEEWPAPLPLENLFSRRKR